MHKDRTPTQAETLNDAIMGTLIKLGHEEHSPGDFTVTLTLRGPRFQLQFWPMDIASGFPDPSEGDLRWCDEIQASAEDAAGALHGHLSNAKGITHTTDSGTDSYSGKLDDLRTALNELRQRHDLPAIDNPNATKER